MNVEPLPHEHVYVRLGASAIHGIGVIAIRHIPKGTNIFANDRVELVWRIRVSAKLTAPSIAISRSWWTASSAAR